MAMWPASSVSGYYFGNPSKYFGLGKIKEDQVIDYAKRRSVSTEVAMKWLNKHSRGTLRETRKVMINNNPDDLFQEFSLRG
jgi:hypothetical protein